MALRAKAAVLTLGEGLRHHGLQVGLTLLQLGGDILGVLEDPALKGSGLLGGGRARIRASAPSRAGCQDHGQENGADGAFGSLHATASADPPRI